MSSFLSAMVAGIIVTVGFNAVLHGISHDTHGFLDRFWKDESSQRVSKTVLFNSIAWHVISDVFIAIFLTVLISLLQQDNIAIWMGTGIITSGIVISVWIHVYAAFELGGRIIVILCFLAVIQITLASIVIGWVYINI